MYIGVRCNCCYQIFVFLARFSTNLSLWSDYKKNKKFLLPESPFCILGMFLDTKITWPTNVNKIFSVNNFAENRKFVFVICCYRGCGEKIRCQALVVIKKKLCDNLPDSLCKHLGWWFITFQVRIKNGDDAKIIISLDTNVYPFIRSFK